MFIFYVHCVASTAIAIAIRLSIVICSTFDWARFVVARDVVAQKVTYFVAN